MRDEDLEALAEQADEEQGFVRRRRVMTDFRYDEQQEKFWDTTTGTLLGAKSVNGAIPRDEWPTKPDGRNGQLKPYPPATAINDVDTGLTVEGSTWWPGRSRFIEDFVITERGAIQLAGAVTYNTYIPPDHSTLRNNQNPDKWIDHVKFLFPDPVEHEHFFDFCAHMIQRPDEKVNHGIVMAGSQGIGKDTAMLPLRRGVGEWNSAEIDPDAVSSQYNPYVKSVLLVINEVRPHDEDHKASNFYNQIKPLLAAPPDMVSMELKYANTIYVRNLCHVFLTTNDPLTMYVPPEDRRLFVMTSPLPDPKRVLVFGDRYFDEMYGYLEDGGADAVVRWLKNRDLSRFNPGCPPEMTAGKKAIIDSAHQVRRTLIDDVLERFADTFFEGRMPGVIFAKDLVDAVETMDFFDDKAAALKMIRGKTLHFKMAERGYDMFRNPHATEWRHGKFRSRMVFCSRDVPREQQLSMIEEELTRRPLELLIKK